MPLHLELSNHFRNCGRIESIGTNEFEIGYLSSHLSVNRLWLCAGVSTICSSPQIRKACFLNYHICVLKCIMAFNWQNIVRLQFADKEKRLTVHL